MMTFTLYWISEDKQGSVDMGTFGSRTEAEAAIQEATDTLLSQALDDSPDDTGLMTKSAVRRGSWSIDETEE